MNEAISGALLYLRMLFRSCALPAGAAWLPKEVYPRRHRDIGHASEVPPRGVPFGRRGDCRSVRNCASFSSNFKLICPVQSRLQKYSASRETQITLTTPAIPSREEGRWPSSRTLGRVAVDAAASGARGVCRADFRERASRADERRLNAFAIASAGMHLAGRSWWRRKLRTAKPCGPGARGWREAGGGLQSSTGQCEPSIRWRWRQEEFVSRESSA